MAKAITQTRLINVDPVEIVRVAILLYCAASLILAGPFLPI
jgi:hypothetical protein